MILVAGGTGRLGTLVVQRLAAKGCKVRVLTRDPARARHLEADAAEIVAGDVRHRHEVDAAVDGIDTVVSAVHGFAGPGRVSPASVDLAGNANLTSAAAEARADMVLVSVVGASPESPMELFRAKFAAEERLRASGVPWTIVRSTAFLELWAEIVGKGIVFGQGDNAINFVSVHDVADVVERAAVDRALRERAVEIGGPENLTFNELAARLHEVTGKPARTRHIPRWALRVMARLHRLPRAALVMDTADMTFRSKHSIESVPATSVEEALARLAKVTTPTEP